MLASIASAVIGCVSFSGSALAQLAANNNNNNAQVQDPGVRDGGAGAGKAIPGLDATETAFFNATRGVFQEVDSVSGTIAGEAGSGLGPRFNMNSCSGCHAQPDVGGSSPFVNPQVAVATLDGARNTVPSFIDRDGPVREARFVNNPDGTPDGGVHDLFVITGRRDARPPAQPTTCNIAQPDFAAAQANNNVIFRVPTPTFGAGLVENTPDRNLQATLASLATMKVTMGISGRFNRTGNDGTITRFGWKAQNKSLLIFAGEAYNVEQGVSNEAFPNEREDDPNCQFNGLPEDPTKLGGTTPSTGSRAADFSSDVVNFAGFMRFLAAPTPAPTTATTARGFAAFQAVGCQACHALNQTTGKSSFTPTTVSPAGLNNVTYHPLSDIALHDMGVGLQDRVSQGNATGREFRSAPLWGVGQRIFFLHDGRTDDLLDAIEDHASQGSEANGVINNFNMLSNSDKQALLVYLRSL
jgi:CxxC motif-containing protein (DUF1111 family)